jgi:hypothetical protein
MVSTEAGNCLANPSVGLKINTTILKECPHKTSNKTDSMEGVILEKTIVAKSVTNMLPAKGSQGSLSLQSIN